MPLARQKRSNTASVSSPRSIASSLSWPEAPRPAPIRTVSYSSSVRFHHVPGGVGEDDQPPRVRAEIDHGDLPAARADPGPRRGSIASSRLHQPDAADVTASGGGSVGGGSQLHHARSARRPGLRARGGSSTGLRRCRAGPQHVRITVRMNSSVMITALETHHSQIAWIVNSSRYVRYTLKPTPDRARCQSPPVAPRSLRSSKRAEDPDVADQAEQRDRDSVELRRLRVPGPSRSGAGRQTTLNPCVVDVGQI